MQAWLEGTKVNQQQQKAVTDSHRDWMFITAGEKGENSVSVFQTVSF